uniref:Uncharacterized protein LOC111124170 n=1 Tax=Crassostrea virginica TaxID=6565 RepID=A0A8B8D7C2_CRAVI|nr:uncharacterized protein LOC111124170 [Crassostrea virginica]
MPRQIPMKKREVEEQSVTPSNAFFGYEGIGKDGILTTPFIATEKFLEVEPSRKRFQAGIQRTLVNGTITQLLSNEQIQQFINSTVIPQHRRKFNAGSATSASIWPQYKPQPKEQNFPTTGLQHIEQIPVTNTVHQHNVPQIESPEHHIPPVILSSGQTNRQTIIQVTPHPQSSRVSKKAKHKQLQGGPKNPTAQFINTSHIPYDHPQTCQSNQLQPWSLLPQAVPSYVKPVEARTRPSKSPQKTSQKVSQEHVEVSRHGCQQGAAKVRPDDTVSDGPQRETTISQTKASSILRSSTKKAGGKVDTQHHKTSIYSSSY